MTVRVCSLTWGTAWERYGQKFAESFAKYWPHSVDLTLVSDVERKLPRGEVKPLKDIVGVTSFRFRWKDVPSANGFMTGVKVDANGYSWRHDAVKWMPQALAPMAVLYSMHDGDIFVWMDADTETTSEVPKGWVQDLLGVCDVACLQRSGTHTEIGFYAMRVNDRTRFALERFAGFYRTDHVFKLKEHHSAYVFDRAIEDIPGLRVRNLNPGGGKGHVWPQSPLAAHISHFKGKRKDSR